MSNNIALLGGDKMAIPGQTVRACPGRTFISKVRVHCMKRSYVLSSFLVLGVMIVAGTLSLRRAQAQGLAGSPEMKAKQLAIEKATPQLQITEDVLHLSIPGQTMGQTVGVSKNSKGHLFVYSRTGPSGVARGGTAAMLFEFDENNKFVKIWGPNNYAASFAHSVRVDKYDNVWMLGSGVLPDLLPHLGGMDDYGERLRRFVSLLHHLLENLSDRLDLGSGGDGAGRARATKQRRNGRAYPCAS